MTSWNRGLSNVVKNVNYKERHGMTIMVLLFMNIGVFEDVVELFYETKVLVTRVK